MITTTRSTGTTGCTAAVIPAANHLALRQVAAVAESGFRMTHRGAVIGRAILPALPRDQETHVARGWPLRSFLELGAYPGAVPSARLHARAVLWEWGLSVLGEPAELIVSELVTNAVQASQSFGQFTPVGFWLLSDREKVLVLVWDASPRSPSPADPGEEIAEGGRGLMLVEAMSQRWSWYLVHDPGGKIVWALCADVGA